MVKLSEQPIRLVKVPGQSALTSFKPLQFAGTDPDEAILELDEQKHYDTTAERLAVVLSDIRQGNLGAATREIGEIVQHLLNLPQGKFKVNHDGTTTVDPNGEEPIVLPATRPVYGPGTDVKTFLDKSFGTGPRLVICPVGWTVPDPDSVASHNPPVKLKFDQAREELSKTLEGDALNKAFTKQKKAILKQYYEEAFRQWWKPVQKELETLIHERGFNNGQVVFLTSASYDGIDKAAIDFAKQSGMKIANVTPYAYASWMTVKDENEQDITTPLLVTNTIDDYAKACSAADVILVTGGREHALKKDIALGLIEGNNLVLPVDIMHEVHDIDVPTFKDGKVENAAAYMLKKGMHIANMSLAGGPPMIPGLTDSQRLTVAALGKLFNQLNIGKPAN